MKPITAFIETVPLLTRPSGISNYVSGLLQEFARQPDAVRCLTGLASGRFARQETLREACRDIAPAMGFIRVPCPNRFAVAAPRLAALLARPHCPAVDLVHATANSFSSWLPPNAKARLLTIHDVVYLRHRGGGMCSPDLEAAMSSRLPDDCRRADLILTDSEFSKSEICDLLRLPPEKVAVAHLASSLEDTASQESGAAQPPSAEPARPYFLYVGSIDPRKNIGTLLDAFDAFRLTLPSARLIMVGKPGWRSAEYLPRIASTPGVEHVPTCTPNRLANLYRQARGTFLVSWYEGFGLPVLEAMGLGCPVCYATGSSMGEIAGDAGIAVRPDDRDSMVEVMRLLWTDDCDVQQLRLQGKARAATFTWKRTAQATLAAYRQALQQQSAR